MKQTVSLFVLILGALSAPVAAEPMVGIWKTEPDRKQLVSHVRVERCGNALCGTILRAFDAQGQAVQTPNIGKRLFWDLKPQGNGSYAGGAVRVPLLNVTASARAMLSGDRLKVTGCKGLICDGQTWTRVN